MLESTNSDSLCVRFAVSAIAVAMEPGAVVNGMVSGKNALDTALSASTRLTVCGSAGCVSGALSICQPPTATASPPPMRSASREMPKKCRIGAPRKNATSSTQTTLTAIFLASAVRSAVVNAAVRSRKTKAIPIGLMMLISPVKPNRMSEIRLATICDPCRAAARLARRSVGPPQTPTHVYEKEPLGVLGTMLAVPRADHIAARQAKPQKAARGRACLGAPPCGHRVAAQQPLLKTM